MTVKTHQEFFRKVGAGPGADWAGAAGLGLRSGAPRLPPPCPPTAAIRLPAHQPPPPTTTAATLLCWVQDFKPPAYLVDTINLRFVLNDAVTRVEARMRVLPNHPAGEHPPLFLNGREGAFKPPRTACHGMACVACVVANQGRSRPLQLSDGRQQLWRPAAAA